MNKSYRSIWNEKVGTFVAVAETAMARGKKNAGGAVCDPEGGRDAFDAHSHQGKDHFPKSALRAAAGVGASVAFMFGGPSAWADASGPTVTTCTNGVGIDSLSTGMS
jgi:hypothetical protein